MQWSAALSWPPDVPSVNQYSLVVVCVHAPSYDPASVGPTFSFLTPTLNEPPNSKLDEPPFSVVVLSVTV